MAPRPALRSLAPRSTGRPGTRADRYLRAARRRGPRHRRGAARARPRARPRGGHHAADQRRIFPQLPRRPARGRHTRADLSAGARFTARRACAPARRHSLQRAHRIPHHGAAGEARGAAAQAASRDSQERRDAAGARAAGSVGHALQAQAQRHRDAPVHLREHGQSQGCHPHPPEPAHQYQGDGPRAARDAQRRVRELAAALPRHGVDRRVDGQPHIRLQVSGDVAAQLPRPAGPLASPTSCACARCRTRTSGAWI